MKTCPNCKMTVSADSECPFWHTSITYEPTVNSDKEKYVLNKYLIWHIVKQCGFSFICFIAVLIRMILRKPIFDKYSLIIIVCISVSVIFSLFQRKISTYSQWKYSAEYALFRVVGLKILFGAVAVLFSFIMW